jgi:glycosyltransferase involved in cell wall biosynthesis
MKILFIHNRYSQAGGEDVSCSLEIQSLQKHGHETFLYERLNKDEIPNFAPLWHTQLAINTIWSRRSHRDIIEILKSFSPDLVHCQNTFPLVSPSVYYACQENRIPVIQHVRNYRLVCASANLYREGAICERCVGKLGLSGASHGCYRNSIAQTILIAALNAWHHRVGTWRNAVDAYIVVSEFLRDKLIQGGFPPNKLHVKPNFIPMPPVDSHRRRDKVLFAGRLVAEKGAMEILEIWRNIPDISLHILGDGPLLAKMKATAAAYGLHDVSFSGNVSHDAAMAAMRNTTCLVVPILWHEPFGRTVIEANAMEVPVVAYRLGAMPELIQPGTTGFLVDPGDRIGFADAIRRLVSDKAFAARLGANARQFAELRFAPSANHTRLMEIYDSVLKRLTATEDRF